MSLNAQYRTGMAASGTNDALTLADGASLNNNHLFQCCNLPWDPSPVLIRFNDLCGDLHESPVWQTDALQLGNDQYRIEAEELGNKKQKKGNSSRNGAHAPSQAFSSKMALSGTRCRLTKITECIKC